MLDGLRRFAAALSLVTERWVPDAWVICMMLTTIALALAVFGAGAGPDHVFKWEIELGAGLTRVRATARDQRGSVTDTAESISTP